ncbi:hypothetical protein [Sphingomonas sp. S2-65]|uniref:hypothetical protein n=1 Tax=Sphingomonas sp. S2-65 TaxID=2903960 RepID=UPI001F36310B|nr:hypothetical protein [Sphingomonas sp. S2-65]UYY59645.1 hypothetical protein LZ586_06055 [Sphingomonas sp. S2-65]
MKGPPLAWGMAGGVASLLVLSPFTADAVGKLDAARTVHARLADDARRPETPAPLLKSGLVVEAPDEAAARAAIFARIAGLSKAGGVLVETVGAVPMPHGSAAVRLRVSGAEKAVLAFADALERQRPVMRLRSWRVEPIAGGGVRLTGEVLAPWQ